MEQIKISKGWLSDNGQAVFMNENDLYIYKESIKMYSALCECLPDIFRRDELSEEDLIEEIKKIIDNRINSVISAMVIKFGTDFVTSKMGGTNEIK